MTDVLTPVGAGLAVVLVGFAIVYAVRRVLRHLGDRAPLAAAVARRARRPAQSVIVLAGAHVTLAQLPPADWHRYARHGLLLAEIAVGGWAIAAILMIAIDVGLSRFRTDVRDNRHARRIHTQMTVVRRVAVAVIAIASIGAMLLTFPAARAAGASLLASAGIAGVIAGFAAQSLLSNVLAGVQLAFSDELRIDDVVVVEGEWGRVEEITLTYVVVRIWDDRRLTLPTSYFLSKPFENWTRTEAAVIGTVELDLDWTVPVPVLREELRAVVAGTDLWDGRTCVLQVTDAVGGNVTVRALVSAVDAPTLWDLRCDVREHLVAYVRDTYPGALPRWRADLAG